MPFSLNELQPSRAGYVLRKMLLLWLTAVLFLAVAIPQRVNAQPSEAQPITLYAHSSGASTILNSFSPAGPGKCANVSKTITFGLSPVLGESLRIYGSVVYTLILNASAPLSGTVSAYLSEFALTGAQIPVDHSSVSDLVALNNRTQTRILGTLPPVDYVFLPGSIIQLNVLVTTQSSATPYLCWDIPPSNSLLPTSVKIPAISPTQAKISVGSSLPRYGENGTIIQESIGCGCARVAISAIVTDPIEISRMSGSLIVTAPNNTSIEVQGSPESPYALVYSYNMSLTNGAWRIGLRLLDNDGNGFSMNYALWIVPFYDATIQIVDQSNESIQSASVEINDTIGQAAMWSTITGEAGNATVSLPSSDVVGPLSLGVVWNSGSFVQQIYIRHNWTSTPIRIPVYHFGVRPVFTGFIPLPEVYVQLQGHRAVANASTGLDGIAHFRVWDGNYTATVTYFWSESACTIAVNSNYVSNCYVPFPGWMKVPALAAVSACVILVAALGYRRRVRLHRLDFLTLTI